MTAFRAASHHFAHLAVGYGSSGTATVSVDSLHMPRALDSIRRRPAPRQPFIAAADRTSVDHGQCNVALANRRDVVQFASLDDRTERRPSLSADIRTGEEMILPSERNGTNCPLNRIGIKFDAAVVQEAREAMPACQRVADGIGELAAKRHAGELLFEPDLELLDPRLRERPPLGQPHRRRLAADALLDGVELTDPPQRFGRGRPENGSFLSTDCTSTARLSKPFLMSV